MREIPRIGIRAAQQSAGRLDQVGDAHVGCEWITSRPSYITFYVHTCRRNLLRVAMNKDPIARLDQNIIQRIARECIV